MIELCYAISDKKTGEEVHRSYLWEAIELEKTGEKALLKI